MIPRRFNSQEWWNNRFSEAGNWITNNGRTQTRLFAEHYCRHTRLEKSERLSILDFGCGLGDAIPVLKKNFPNSTLSGCDISKNAVTKCRKNYGEFAQFFVANVKGINRHYDVIYCSNVLEHFAEPMKIARQLLKRCTYMSIMVPYREMYQGNRIEANEEMEHQSTIDDDTLIELTTVKNMIVVNKYIAPCPNAWGWSVMTRVKEEAKNLLRPILGKEVVLEPRQILIELKHVF